MIENMFDRKFLKPTLNQGWPSEQILLIGSEISGLKIFADRIGPELEKNVIGSDRRPYLKFADRIGLARIFILFEKMSTYGNKV
jgi:hypothetical protein